MNLESIFTTAFLQAVIFSVASHVSVSASRSQQASDEEAEEAKEKEEEDEEEEKDHAPLVGKCKTIRRFL